MRKQIGVIIGLAIFMCSCSAQDSTNKQNEEVSLSQEEDLTDKTTIMGIPSDKITSIDIYTNGNKIEDNIQSEAIVDIFESISENRKQSGYLDLAIQGDIEDAGGIEGYSQKEEVHVILVHLEEGTSTDYNCMDGTVSLQADSIFVIPEKNLFGTYKDEKFEATFSNLDKEIFETAISKLP